ncbi:MAG: SLC13 family permease [Pseudomonadota bacterium]
MRVALSAGTAAIGVAMGGGLLAYGMAVPEEAELWKAAGLGLAALTLFATRVVPELVTAFAVFLVALALATVPREIVFSGFMSGGFWLLVSGIILGTAISSTGLAARISGRMMAVAGPSYPRAVLVIAAAGMFLGLLIPSTMPRIVVMVPVALSFASRLGLRQDGPGTVGLVATAVTATLLPTYTILTANLPTIVHVGAIDQLYGVRSTYSGYLWHQLPVNILRFALLVVLMRRFTTEPVTAATDTSAPETPEKPEQRRLLAILAVAILLWMTDFIHGIEPAWIAMAAAAVVIWPRFGMLGPKAMREQIDLSPAIFFAAIVTAVAVARDSGLDQLLADAIIGAIPISANGGLASTYGVFFFSVVISHLTTAPAAPAVLAPFAQPLAHATGLSLEAVSMTQIIGISTPLIPYQAPPLIVAMSLSGLSNGVFMRICLWLAVAVTLLGIPLSYAWWWMTGFV